MRPILGESHTSAGGVHARAERSLTSHLTWAGRVPSLVIVVGVGSPHHTGISSVQLRILCAISAIKEVTSSQCAEL